MNKQDLYRQIPKVDRVMGNHWCRQLVEAYGERIVLSCVRTALDDMRAKIESVCSDTSQKDTGDPAHTIQETVGEDALERAVRSALKQMTSPGLKRVINATGTILHTNLGRAPIGRKIGEQALEKVTGYTNIEYDLQTGERGERGGRCEELLVQLSGAEDALIVNNNAASVLLMLHALGKGGEVIVSRGELVEIGGQFRIPDVMQASGCTLREVGTTNKTRLSDYEQAITDRTSVLMKVHTSNYRIVGFTDAVSTGELAELAHTHQIPMIEDLGSGALIDLAGMGIGDEPTVQACVLSGADLICFSADKLLGGPQAGIILGKHSLIEQLRHHPMMRALRTDKFTAAVLELTLLAYLNEDQVRAVLPALSMADAKADELQEKAERLAAMIRSAYQVSGLASGTEMTVSVEAIDDQIGGGALPLEKLSGYAVRIHGKKGVSEEVRLALVQADLPIVARIMDGDLCLSVRTIDEADLEQICAVVSGIVW